MKKTFPLQAPGKDDARVRDKIRHEVNKYVRRERLKKLPEGFDLWNLHCKVGGSAQAAEAQPLKEVGAAIDAVAQTGAAEVYVEVVAVAGHRTFSRPL
jgi:hypothetical protein